MKRKATIFTAFVLVHNLALAEDEAKVDSQQSRPQEAKEAQEVDQVDIPKMESMYRNSCVWIDNGKPMVGREEVDWLTFYSYVGREDLARTHARKTLLFWGALGEIIAAPFIGLGLIAFYNSTDKDTPGGHSMSTVILVVFAVYEILQLGVLGVLGYLGFEKLFPDYSREKQIARNSNEESLHNFRLYNYYRARGQSSLENALTCR